MTGPLILDAERAVTLSQPHLDRVTRAAVALLLTPRDEQAYQRARSALLTVPAEARWMVELVVEVELAANGVPLRYPSGIRW